MEQAHTFGMPLLQNRRLERSMRAKETIGEAIPEILRSSARARRGVQQVDLIVDPDIPAHHGAESTAALPDAGPNIRLLCADTLEAAARMAERPFAQRRTGRATSPETSSQRPNVAVLSFASASRPGGGFVDGANSQEEFLCARSTLWHSLSDSLYPLPDIGGVLSPDVMVFRDSTPEANDLLKIDRFFVDVISANMPRFPDGRGRSEERLEHACTCGVSYCDRDRDIIVRKMKAVLRMAQMRGTERLVLGAWGCGGAHGHPIKEVAKLWRKVIAGGPRQRKPNAERWQGIKEIVFAIPDRSMASEFELAFKDVLTYGVISPPAKDENTTVIDVGKVGNSSIDDMVVRMQELELELENMQTSRSKQRLRDELAIINRDLARASALKRLRDEGLLLDTEDADPVNDEDEDYVAVDAIQSDAENTFYSLDDGSDSSEALPVPDAFEFRPQPPELDFETSLSEDELDGDSSMRMNGLLKPSPRFNPKTGWFNGSIDQLHGMLKRGGPDMGSHASPTMEPETGGGLCGVEEYALNDYLEKHSGQEKVEH
ncbi:hypothetical protein BAUCODRAFT_409264 [Baudoinia panamericana UAMH 10762]|uniref:Microbial-type PARG catalytic domain-containing protein n=1 Tax=Baudoinia panamericana (strain UAMH 10762) TaxID=717646 RepID=M2N204_BAUPA|nr:uncharacterized protein BAUCODRAFT_409264 [Baudoinia panamericana UAMH 10762]EMC97958.1 hypothetical protein BAUCODRAFT_409264 [Baudoinia panamericana UAMH 10762]